jgi:type II secretory pathway component PulC
MRIKLLIGLLGSGLVACGASTPAPNSVAAPARTTQATMPAAGKSAQRASSSPSAPGTIKRSTVREFLAEGPGHFLQRIDFETDPVRRGGKFVGFRVTALKGAEFWNGVDLAPGDVITSINGTVIERPEHFFEVFRSLDSAKELRVGFERDSKARELKWAIVDDDPRP